MAFGEGQSAKQKELISILLRGSGRDKTEKELFPWTYKHLLFDVLDLHAGRAGTWAQRRFGRQFRDHRRSSCLHIRTHTCKQTITQHSKCMKHDIQYSQYTRTITAMASSQPAVSAGCNLLSSSPSSSSGWGLKEKRIREGYVEISLCYDIHTSASHHSAQSNYTDEIPKLRLF